MKFTFRDGGGGPVPPDVMAAEFTRIFEVRGALTASDVVDEARPEGAALHPAFEWDDSKAGEAYRRQQARTMIKLVRVETESSRSSLPAFVNVVRQTPDGPARSYVPVQVALADSSALASALSAMRQKVAYYSAEIRHLNAASKVPKVAQALLAEIDEEIAAATA